VRSLAYRAGCCFDLHLGRHPAIRDPLVGHDVELALMEIDDAGAVYRLSAAGDRCGDVVRELARLLQMRALSWPCGGKTADALLSSKSRNRDPGESARLTFVQAHEAAAAKPEIKARRRESCVITISCRLE
jgi:hypothetical protein